MDIIICRECERVNCPHGDKVRANYICDKKEEGKEMVEEQRYIALSFSEPTYRWGIWDIHLNQWVVSKTEHRFIFATLKAAQNKASRLENQIEG